MSEHHHQPTVASPDRQDAEEPLCGISAGGVDHPGMLPLAKAQRMSEFLGFLADTNRLRIIALLASGEMCVGGLAAALAMNESAVSHQLRTLRAIRLVDFRKQGRHVFYRLEDDHVLNFYYSVLEHLEETAS